MEVIMADDPVNPRALPFNIPEGLDALKARDPEFWAAYASWKAAESAYNAFAGDYDGPLAGVMLGRATGNLDEALATPVRTAVAVLAKLDAVREAYIGDFSVLITGKVTVGDIVRFDLERLAKLEMFGPDAFQDMAEG
jgi:hypothetical protein